MAGNSILDDVCHLVLENWAMMLVDNSELAVEGFLPEEPFFTASVRYDGVFYGALTILAQKPFMEALARNVLGLDPDVTLDDNQTEDAFTEMANVVSGNYLTAAYGDDVEFDLVLPRVEQVTAERAAELIAKQNKACYIADELPVVVCSELFMATKG